MFSHQFLESELSNLYSSYQLEFFAFLQFLCYLSLILARSCFRLLLFVVDIALLILWFNFFFYIKNNNFLLFFIVSKNNNILNRTLLWQMFLISIYHTYVLFILSLLLLSLLLLLLSMKNDNTNTKQIFNQ